MAVEQRTIPVSPSTRDRVRELREGRTYDELLEEWAERAERDG
jgi:hypothetical protein